MSPTFTFLIAPIEAVGHFHACTGIGQQLLKRGHRVVFATPNSWRGKLKPFGFEEQYIQDAVVEESNEKWGDIVSAMAPALAMPSIGMLEFLYPALYQEVVNKAKNSDAKLREIMATIQPDVVLVDNVAQLPALMDQGVPWVHCTSLCPLGSNVCEELPPGFAGYPIFDGNKSDWEKHNAKQEEVFRDIFADFKNWVLEKGGPELEYQASPFWQVHSPYANICMFPDEMSYTMHAPDPPNWHRFDAFVREESGTFALPSKLEALPGKLIFFSMGSIGSCELNLMRKLIAILAKSPHRFIVSKGPLGDKLELADNMWGANHLPQTLILPLVDMVITHGGNNTVTESFYFGKPILVLPLFCDQLDNGTRVEETGHGLRFQPYHVTEEELLTGIETLVNDDLLKKRMATIGMRIRGSNSQSRAADVVESVALKYCVGNQNCKKCRNGA